MTSNVSSSRLRLRLVGALLIVYLVWGSTYVAIRFAVGTLPPLLMCGTRFLVAGAALYLVCAWQRWRRPDAGWSPPTRREWRAGLVIGLALPAAGTGGASWAEQELPAGITALLLASIPVWITLAGRLVDRERIGLRTGVGLALGVVGVVVLVNPFSGGAPDPVATTVALLGAICWGCGSVYVKHAPTPDQPLLPSAIEMLWAGVALWVVGAATGELGRIDPGAISAHSLLALAYLIVFGSMVAYSAYEWLLRHAPKRLAGSYAFVNPLVAVALGSLLLDERVTGRTVWAAAIIVGGVALIVLQRRPRGSANSVESPYRSATRRQNSGTSDQSAMTSAADAETGA